MRSSSPHLSLAYLLSQEYLKNMIDVMHHAEDLESLENLHPLCSLMQTIRAFSGITIRRHLLISCLPRSYDERS